MDSVEDQARHFAKGEVAELEARLGRIILYVELAMFVAVATVVAAIEYLLLGSIGVTEAAIALFVGLALAMMAGSRLWGIYNEIKAKAVHFVNEQGKKLRGH